MGYTEMFHSSQVIWSKCSKVLLYKNQPRLESTEKLNYLPKYAQWEGTARQAVILESQIMQI